MVHVTPDHFEGLQMTKIVMEGSIPYSSDRAEPRAYTLEEIERAVKAALNKSTLSSFENILKELDFEAYCRIAPEETLVRGIAGETWKVVRTRGREPEWHIEGVPYQYGRAVKEKSSGNTFLVSSIALSAKMSHGYNTGLFELNFTVVDRLLNPNYERRFSIYDMPELFELVNESVA
jgi:hypothetical protein